MAEKTDSRDYVVAYIRHLVEQKVITLPFKLDGGKLFDADGKLFGIVGDRVDDAFVALLNDSTK